MNRVMEFFLIGGGSAWDPTQCMALTLTHTRLIEKAYLFQQANGNVSVQGPLVSFIQHNDTKDQRQDLSDHQKTSL